MRVLLDAGNPFVSALPASVYRHPLCQSLAPSIPEPCPAAARRLTAHAHVHLFPSTLHLYGLPSICPRFAEDSWPQPTEKKARNFQGYGTGGKPEVPKVCTNILKKCSKNSPKMLPQTSPNRPPNPPKWLPKPDQEKDANFDAKRPPKWCSKGSPKAPFWRHFSNDFLDNFWEGSGNPPRPPPS